MPAHSRIHLIQNRLVAAFSLFYVTVLSIACYLKFAAYQYLDFDLAVHTQSLHNMLRGSLDCSLLGIPYFGNHMALFLVFIAPFYAILPSPVTLLMIQTFVLASGSVALLFYARRHLPHPYPALIAVLYLLYPPLTYMNLYEFHPVALATPLLLFALLAYDQRKPRIYALMLFLAMACQENIALIVIMLGLKALLDKRRAGWIAGPVLAGAAWFAVCVFWIMPKLNPGIVSFESIYAHLADEGSSKTLSGIAFAILKNPVKALTCALAPGKLLYLLSLLLPLALTPLISPLSLMPALPVLAQRLLSIRGTETTILYHYQAELIPFIFIAAVHGLKRLGALRKPADARYLAALCMAAMTVLSLDMTDLPTAIMSIPARAKAEKNMAMAYRKMLSFVSSDAHIAATFRCLPHLANRSDLHSVHHIYTGHYTLSNVNHYPTPTDLDLVLIDASDPLTFSATGFYTPGGETNLQHLFEVNHMRIVARSGPMVMLAGTHSKK